MLVEVTCSRCQKKIEGYRTEGFQGFTSGFYDTSGGTWGKYADPGETILCDHCMQHDPRYIADYFPPQDPS